MKEKLYLIIAAISILFGAYGLGHRSAKKSNELRNAKVERDILRETVDTKNEVRDEISRYNSRSVNEQLRTDWLRK